MLSLHKNPILCILAPLISPFYNHYNSFALFFSYHQKSIFLCSIFSLTFFILFVFFLAPPFFFISFFFFFSFSLTIVMIFFPEIIDARMHERCIRSTIPKKRNQQHNAVITFKFLERQGDYKKNIFITLVYPRWSTFFFHFNSLLPEVLLHEQMIWICI